MDPGSAAHRFALRSIRGTKNQRPGTIPAFFFSVIASEAKQSSVKDDGLLRRLRSSQ